MTTATKAMQIQEALVTLRELTARGVEYPDAEFRVSQGRDVEKLRALCEKPSPGSLAEAMHERDLQPSAEDFWSTECWNCGYVCRCEV